jgi:alpha-galactosidase
MPIKVAIIGAGSIGFTRSQVRDILTVPELQDTEFALMDLNPHNLDMVYQLVDRDLQASGLPAKVTATTDRREAFTDADYVFSFARIGGLEAYAFEIDIPLKYGVDQCVGDTLAPGGIMFAQRTIPALLDFCQTIREVSKPGCVFINHTNPMAMNTWACQKYGGVPMIGLCHGVEGGQMMIGGALGIPWEELDILCAGINHQTWYLRVEHKGEDLTDRILPAFEADETLSQNEKCRIDMMRRFGYFSTESNGHLSEYLPWYRKRPDDIDQWIDMGVWINGETGGYLRVSTEGRNWFEHDFPNWMKEPPLQFTPDQRGHELGSYIIESLETGRIYRGHVNMTNNGVITNLPDDCIIEAPGYVDRLGLHMPVIGDLPLGCAAVLNASISVQRLAVEAAVHGDDMLLRQAMLLDPLTAAVCNPPEVWQMVDELLVAQEQWLPQYGPAIAAAKQRLAGGPQVPLRPIPGHKLPTKTLEELAADREAATKLAAEADKGKERTAGE